MLMKSKSKPETQKAEITPPPPPAPPAAELPSSVIARDLRIVGDLICEGTLQIDGEVSGNVECETLYIGEGGHVTGNVHARSLRISGTVDGEIEAEEVLIARTAKMIGDVRHVTLTVEHGAHFEGRSLKCGDISAKSQRLSGPNGKAKPAAGRSAGNGSGSESEAGEAKRAELGAAPNPVQAAAGSGG